MHDVLDIDRLERAYQTARSEMLRCQFSNGCWEGRLSSSALATATSISAFSVAGCDSQADRAIVDSAVSWLLPQQNYDGGWGDTIASASNISTTMLVVAALHLADKSGLKVLESAKSQIDKANRYIENQGGHDGLRRRYGRDKTFAVPILMNCALAGLADWDEIPTLPFEAACLPQSWYRFARMPVVSYAIPALVAVGQAIHHHRRRRGILGQLIRPIRNAAIRPTCAVLEKIQPESGGYLEAMPLTGFVAMALASTGANQHSVVQRGLQFLRDTVRADGSWPIDTNLATWNTTLSIVSLRGDDSEDAVGAMSRTIDWLLDCQFTKQHPYTGAAPGGWGWSSLSGAVPDADDTAGALLALDLMREAANPDQRARIQAAGKSGAKWLVRLQNSDGGWPTFCKGWGKLPFDRSGTDLTAHALRALARWSNENQAAGGQATADQGTADQAAIDRAIWRGWSYLRDQQNADGSWTPLWFGNQLHPDEENPIYGTSKVLIAYRDFDRSCHESTRGRDWLLGQQNQDGGWGARPPDPKKSPDTTKVSGQLRVTTAAPISASTVEETALAVEALLASAAEESVQPVLRHGIEWLIRAVESGSYLSGSPIGLYFAKLWYDEAMYPLVFTVSALGKARRISATLPAIRGDARMSRHEADGDRNRPRPHLGHRDTPQGSKEGI